MATLAREPVATIQVKHQHITLLVLITELLRPGPISPQQEATRMRHRPMASRLTIKRTANQHLGSMEVAVIRNNSKATALLLNRAMVPLRQDSTINILLLKEAASNTHHHRVRSTSSIPLLLVDSINNTHHHKVVSNSISSIPHHLAADIMLGIPARLVASSSSSLPMDNIPTKVARPLFHKGATPPKAMDRDTVSHIDSATSFMLDLKDSRRSLVQ